MKKSTIQLQCNSLFPIKHLDSSFWKFGTKLVGIVLLITALFYSTESKAGLNPVISPATSISNVPDNTPGLAPVGQVYATLGTTSAGTSLTYTFTSGSPDFVINSSTGEISVSGSAVLDYQFIYSYQVEVQDNDLPANTTYETFTIPVVQATTGPIFPNQNLTILANTPINDIITNVSASPGTGNITSYSLNSCSGCIGSEFTVDNSTGDIRVTDNSGFQSGNTYSLNITVYDDTPLDYTGTITVSISSGGGTQDPRLEFSPPQIQSYVYGDRPFYLNAYSLFGSNGAITYSLGSATNAADIDPFSGLVTIKGAGTASFQASIAADGIFFASTTMYTITIDKAPTIFSFEDQGNEFSGGAFLLYVSKPLDYDGTLSFSFGGATSSIISLDPNTGLVTPLDTGSAVVLVSGSGATNYEDSPPYYARITIYEQKLNPVAIDDSIQILFGSSTGKVNILSNDYGITGKLSSNIDIDLYYNGNQSYYPEASLGQFQVDTAGWLTYTPFKGFIGTGAIQYVIYDNDGLVSNVGTVHIIVDSPGEEPELVANEVMTPNGDGQNDALVIGYANTNNNNKFWILDENGSEVFYAENYKNDWSGTDKKKSRLTSGVYYYIYKEYNNDGDVLRTYSNFCQIMN